MFGKPFVVLIAYCVPPQYARYLFAVFVVFLSASFCCLARVSSFFVCVARETIAVGGKMLA